MDTENSIQEEAVVAETTAEEVEVETAETDAVTESSPDEEDELA